MDLFFHNARYTVASILRYNILHATVNLVDKKMIYGMYLVKAQSRSFPGA